MVILPRGLANSLGKPGYIVYNYGVTYSWSYSECLKFGKYLLTINFFDTPCINGNFTRPVQD